MKRIRTGMARLTAEYTAISPQWYAGMVVGLGLGCVSALFVVNVGAATRHLIYTRDVALYVAKLVTNVGLAMTISLLLLWLGALILREIRLQGADEGAMK